jgi:osmotically-inducible protein OsmY
MRHFIQVSVLTVCLTGTLPLICAAQNQNAPTAENQKNDAADRKMTADIRKSVVDDKSLSTQAHNVKIITRNGEVTLRGRLKSEDERQNIVAKAEQIAGKGHVHDMTHVGNNSAVNSGK